MSFKLSLSGANPLETKEVAGLLGGLDEQYLSVVAVGQYLRDHATQDAYTVVGLRAFCKHSVEAVESFLPGGRVLVEDLVHEAMSADEIVEAVQRTALWGRSSSLVIPLSLAGLEAAHLLTRSGTSPVFNMVSSVDQVLAAIDVTSGGMNESITVIVPIDELYAHGINGTSEVASILALQETNSLLLVYLEVQSLATLVWGIEQGINGVIVPYEVCMEWLSQQKPVTCTPDMLSLLALGTNSTSHVQASHENYSYTISNTVTDAILRRTATAWQTLLE